VPTRRKHLWTRLIWLADIAETLYISGEPGVPARLNPSTSLRQAPETPFSTTQTIDYALVFSRARTLGIARVLGVSFWLVKNVLRVEIPKPAEK